MGATTRHGRIIFSKKKCSYIVSHFWFVLIKDYINGRFDKIPLIIKSVLNNLKY